jgi:hypothetical protein
VIKPGFSIAISQKYSRNLELSRILTAAIINDHFRSLLLNDPLSAVEKGYSDESFSLEPEEKKKIGNIHSSSLSDFAGQLSAI